jgi:Ala-tRNA(Pro) deacylase
MNAADLLIFLNARSIPFAQHAHAPVYTCEEAQRLVPRLPGARTKNLFLADKKGRRHMLLVVPQEKRVDLDALSAGLDAKGLRLASNQRLQRYLGVTPGAVSLLALVNDVGRAVELVVDEALWAAEAFQCHPLDNSATLVIAHGSMQLFLAATGHSPRIIPVPAIDQPQ